MWFTWNISNSSMSDKRLWKIIKFSLDSFHLSLSPKHSNLAEPNSPLPYLSHSSIRICIVTSPHSREKKNKTLEKSIYSSNIWKWNKNEAFSCLHFLSHSNTHKAATLWLSCSPTNTFKQSKDFSLELPDFIFLFNQNKCNCYPIKKFLQIFVKFFQSFSQSDFTLLITPLSFSVASKYST